MGAVCARNTVEPRLWGRKPAKVCREVRGLTPATRTLQVRGQIPLEVWNRLGTRILRKLRAGTHLRIAIDFSIAVPKEQAANLEKDLRQSLDDLGLGGNVRVD